MRRSIGCSWRFWGALFLLSSFSWIGACQGPEALTRPQTVEGETFGAKFFTLACQRVAYTSSLAAHAKDPSRPIDVSGSRYRFACRYGPKFLSVANAQVEDPKVAALFARRDDFIKAIDLIFPGSELTELQAYMVKILDLTDDGRFPAVVEKSAAALDLFRADLSVNQALARVESRLGYRPRSVALGILREALNYPKLKETLDCFLSLVGEGGKGEASFKKLTEALSYELRTARRVDDPTRSDPVHPGSSLRTLRLGLDLLFASDPAFASGTSHWLVARDWRGVAQVRRTSTGVASPFVDKDGDGLADVDNLGYLVTTSGAAPPRPFHHDPQKPDLALVRDSYGRALDATGNPLYVYRDLDATLLGALVRDSAQLVDPIKDTALKALEGLIAILGPRKAQTRKGTKGETIAYQGFDSAASPILDLAYAGLTMLRDPAILGTLEGLKTLMVDHEPEVARSIAAMRRSSDIADKYPARNVDSRSTLYDELFILLRQMVNTPGLLEDVLASMKDPRTKNLDRMFANYFKYADVHVLGSGDKVVSQSGGSTLFSREVDRSKPDSGANRSMQQRLFHVVHDTNGMRICSKAGAQILVPSIMSFSPCKTSPCKECDLFQVDNGAVFYMQSMVFARDATGKLTTTRKATLRLKTEKMTALVAAAITGLGTDLILKTMTEIDGMGAHPTTQALNRLMFMETMPAMLAAAQDLPRDRDGDLMIKDHKGSLYSWEIPHPGMSCSANDPCVFYQAFQPIAQAFADHDAEKILVDLMSVVHEHWSSSKSTDYQYKDPKASNYSHGSNAVSYEPAILEIMEKGDLLAALRELSKVVDATKLRDGTALSAQLTKTARFALDPARTPGLAYRDGRTKAMWSDGLTEASGGVTPMYLLVDAWNAVDGALDRVDKHVGDAWREASDHIVDVFMGTQSTPDPKGRPEVRFSNRHVIPTVRVGVDFLSQRILAHSPSCSSSGQCVGGGTCLSNGRCTTRHINDDTAAWAGAKLPADLEDILTGPLPAAAADFVTVLRQDPKADTAVGDILKYLVDELHHDAVFSATLTGLGDMLQLLLDDESLVPLARALGKALGADLGLVDAIMRFAKPAVARDNVGALTRILGNAVKEQSPGESPLEKLFEMSKEMHRQKPGDAAHYTAEDYGQALFEIRDFLGNEGTGLVHFFDIIKTRCGGPCAAPGQS